MFNLKKAVDSSCHLGSTDGALSMLFKSIKSLLFCFLGVAMLNLSHAQTTPNISQQLIDLGSESRETLQNAILSIAASGHPSAATILSALQEGSLRIDATGQAWIVSGDMARDAVSGATRPVDSLVLHSPAINNKIRRLLSSVVAQSQLASSDKSLRLAAAEELIKRPREDAILAMSSALKIEKDSEVKEALTLALAKVNLASNDQPRRLAAIATMQASGSLEFLSDLKDLLKQNEDKSYLEKNSEVRDAAKIAVAAIERKQFFISQAGNFFYGLSLGSILLLAALGLAITFGLMGVINMAHGELLMLGAYSTYVVQMLFRNYFPDMVDWYLLVALPTAFVVTAAIGIFLERTVIRHLYGRPLETLLATWGISLMLIQTVRLVFGAQNVEVANPSWLSGGVELVQGVVLPYNRLAIIVFAIFVVSLVWVLLQRTRMGLQVRAVTQNRSMAAAMGISTSRVDMWTFGLGAGVAGLGGVALSQIGNVGPELGQAYIVDSFMVVVLGGVGKIAGTIVGAMGLGIVNKFLEPVSGAVLAKIAVLVFIILFIQKRPQGIFALKGRTAEG